MNAVHYPEFLSTEWFAFELNHSPNKWKKFFIDFIKGDTEYHGNSEYHTAGLLSAARYMMKNPDTASLDEFFDAKQNFDILAENNAKNMGKIIELIWKNSWEKENWNLNNFGSDDWYKKIIYHEDFKEICKTPIFLPIFYSGILSGEYLLNLLHSDVSDNKKIFKIKWEKDYNENKNATEPKNDSKGDIQKYDENYGEKWRRFFSEKSNSNCYKQQFEQVLSMSFEKFENVKDGKRGILWELFEWYGYIEYDLYEKKPKLKNLLAEVLKNPYFSGGAFNAYLTGKMELPKLYQGMTLLKTLLLQNINFKTQSKINVLVGIVSKLRFCMEFFVDFFQNYLFRITRAEILQPKNGIQKLDELVTEQLHWIEEKISEISKRKKPVKNELGEIKATKEELYKFIFVKIICRELQALKSTYENNFILFPKIFDKYDQVRLYCEIDPNEKIEVDDWETFQEKYSFQLKKFFPEVTDDEEMKKYWLCAVSVLAFCFPAKFGLVVDEETVPKVMSVKWLKDHGVNIGQIGTAEIFLIMCLIIYSKKQPIKLKGDDTAFYQYILDETNTTIEDRKGLLFVDALQKIQKHYLSKQKPAFNETLTFQIIWWVSEKSSSFMLTKEAIDIRRKFLMSVLTAIENILKFEDLDFCLTELEKLNSWLNSVGKEIFEINFGTELQ